MKCLTNGKLKGGGQRTTRTSWNYTMFNSSIAKLFRFLLHQDMKMRAQGLNLPRTALITPPLDKERSRNFHRPMGVGYSSSDSLDHQPTQSHQCFNSTGIASTPKLSSISRAKTETSSIDGSAKTSSSREADQSGELSICNASDIETEWVEQDELGVYITVRALPSGTRELRRVRFS